MFSNEKILKELYYDKFYNAGKKSLQFQGEIKCSTTNLTWEQMKKMVTIFHLTLQILLDRCIIYSWYHEESPLEGSQEPSPTILIRSFLLKKMKILGQGSPEWFLVSWTSGMFKIINLVSNLPLAGVPKGLRLRCLGTFMGCCSSVKWGTISTFIGIRRGVRCI